MLLHGFSVDPKHASGRAASLAFLQGGAVRIRLEKPVTLLVGENGCGKTTLLEAIAAGCSIHPEGGDSYTELEDERDATALSEAVTVSYGGIRPPKGMFLRADRLDDAARSVRGRIRMATTGEWRRANEQSRGETVLSLMSARIDESEGELFLLDEPEVALSPQRQMALLCLMDNVHRDGRSQIIMATHAPMLMAYPNADILWVDDEGIRRRSLAELEHWKVMRRLLDNPDLFMKRLLGD
jgi:predicted ATPase